jgi:hypothetical protein
MRKPPKAGGRLRNPRPEQDVAADTKKRDTHRGTCRGYLDGVLGSVREFLTEPKDDTLRVHSEDARQIKYLLLEFETEMIELIKHMRIQQRGVRDLSIAAPMADLSNVVAFPGAAVRP